MEVNNLREIQLNQALSPVKQENNLKNNSNNSYCFQVNQPHWSLNNLSSQSKQKKTKNKKINTFATNTVINEAEEKRINFSAICLVSSFSFVLLSLFVFIVKSKRCNKNPSKKEARGILFA